jgi:hypothetical protein
MKKKAGHRGLHVSPKGKSLRANRVAAANSVPPSVTGIVPGGGSTAGGTTVTITGTGFTGATDVAFGLANAASMTVDSDIQITAVSPKGAGPVDVTVTTAGGTSGVTAADQFIFGTAPTVTSINPSSGPARGQTIVIITGTGFTGATGVNFGLASATNMTVNSDTQIAVVSPAGSGTAGVTVTTAVGTSAASAANQFTYVPSSSSGGYRAPTSVSQYAGILPYDSELFGVYRPLLNWYGYQATTRVAAAKAQAAAGVIQLMAQDQNVVGDGSTITDPIAGVHLQLADALQSNVAQRIADAASQIVSRTGQPPTPKDWSKLLAPNALTQTLSDVVASQPHGAGSQWPATKGIAATGLAGTSTSAMPGNQGAGPSQVQLETATANFLTWAANHSPDTLNALFLTTVPAWRKAINFINPFSGAAGGGGNLPTAVLSPVGLINLYREYFYELDTFLGPPTGHVWVSPGGSLELYEISTRKTTVTKTVETSTTQTAKDEVDTTDQDELSTAVKNDNKSDTKLGASANASGSFAGIVQVGASASFNTDTSVATSSEEAHKHSRTQSEKLSKEITQNFKTTFQTVTETTDTTSRRYVLANNTDALANYELRRKMRLIGVQLQHIGTRLSWQIYVPNPATLLGVGEFVPVSPDNSAAAAIQPPPPLTPLAPKQTEMTVDFPLFPKAGEADIARNDDDYWIDGNPPGMHNADNTRHIWGSNVYITTPPDTGYTLSGIVLKQSSNAGGSDLRCVPEYQFTPGTDNSFTVQMLFVNFGGHNSISLDLLLNWDPPVNDPRLPDYQKAYQTYQANLAAAQLQDYVNATRALVKTVSTINPRATAALRYEERDAIYRVLYEKLSQIPIAGGADTAHITAEYIRELFDVDEMLYFVEPDYYWPHSQPYLPPTPGFPSPGGDLLSAPGATVSSWPRRPTTDYYLITEDSQPAPQGTSLGWTIQLDGDDRRNEFLNSAWVKAVIPIQPGRELDALAWLQNENVEGVAGLNAPYAPVPPDPDPTHVGTIGQVLNMIAAQLAAQNKDIGNTLSTETVFEKGFDPLADGIKLDPTLDFKGTTAGPYQMFDFWLEVLPTDQVVAVDYDPTQHGA